jgi:hypothetical protein
MGAACCPQEKKRGFLDKEKVDEDRKKSEIDAN